MSRTCETCHRAVVPGELYFAGPFCEHLGCRALREKERERIQDCVALRARAHRAEALLRRAHAGSGDGRERCPLCGCRSGHADDCELHAFVRGLGDEPC